MKIEQASPAKVTDLWVKVEPKVQKSKSLEEAAQELANELHTQFSDSVALARVFITVPFGTPVSLRSQKKIRCPEIVA